MIELIRHIEILLLGNDCVIVPNFGGFMAHHVESRYDGSDGMMLPPVRTLGFNPKLKMNDSLLAQSYSECYDISYPEAVHRMEHDINILKLHLENNGRCEMPGLGTLMLNSEGNYEFEPLEAGLLTPSLYGFGAIELTQMKEVRTNNATSGPLVMPLISPRQNSVSQSNQQNLATIMSHIDENESRTEEKTISIKGSVLRNLAVTAVAAVALVIFARPVPTNEPNTPEAAATEASVLSMPTHDEQEVEVKDAVSINGSLDVVSQKISSRKKASQLPSVGHYTIVLGCSLPLENAKNYLAQVQAKGAEEAILWDYKSNNMIVCGNYNTKEEALPRLQEIATYGISGWILEVK